VTNCKATCRRVSFFCPSSSLLNCLLNFTCFFLLAMIAGCASRHVTAGGQPAPSQPSAASPDTIESTKRATDAGPASAPATPSPKRSKPSQSPAPAGYVEEGNASWYGVPFNGRRASNGEIYDMYKLTAAHRTLPFETMVRVTNLHNGKSTTVRITDRVPVRVEVLTEGIDPTGGFFTVQVGAFRDQGNAQRLRDRLNPSYSPIFIQQYDSPDGTFYRVRVGKVSGEDAARQFGEQLRNREGVTPIVVRLDEATPSGGD
jgi:rare lipoprotein A